MKQDKEENLSRIAPLLPNNLDVGSRSRFRQSSFLELGHRSDYLMPSAWPGGFFFHTHLDLQPWCIVDLGRSRSVGEIVLWNREDVGDEVIARACPLLVEVSEDESNWHVLEYVSKVFGGRISGVPHVICITGGVSFRYLRITLKKSAHFHLDYIEILQFLPKTSFGFYNNLMLDRNGVVTADYMHFAINGLYSGYSTALHDICILAKAGIAVRDINMSMSFCYFKDGVNEDAHKVFFKKVSRLALEDCKNIEFVCTDVHRAYRDLPLDCLNRVADWGFHPSGAVEARSETLIRTSDIDLSRTIAVVYRGTDKNTEVNVAPVAEYIAVVEEIKNDNPGYQVLIQTDQEQIRNAFIQKFGDECKYFQCLPVTSETTVIHQQFEKVSVSSRQRFSEDLMAAILVCARAHTVVIHTGNVAGWLAIYRGNVDNLYQFDANGILLKPNKNGVL